MKVFKSVNIRQYLKNYKEYFLIILLLFVLNVVFFPRIYIKHEVLTSADILFAYEPWDQFVDPGFKGSNGLLADTIISYYPTQKHLFNQIKEGEFPLWNNSMGLGSARGGNSLSLIINPFLIIPLLLTSFNNFGFAITFNSLSHSLLCGFFTYLLLRKYKIGKAGSTLGAIIGSFSLYNIVYLVTSLVHVSTFIPLVLWSMEKLFERTNNKNALIFIGSYSLLILGGFYSTIAYVTFMFIFYILLKSIYRYLNKESIKIIVKRIFIFLISGMAIVGLLAFTLLPTADYLLNKVDLSYRTETHSERYISKDLLIRYIIPEYFGNPVDYNWQRPPFKPSPSNNFNESAVYIGLFPLLLSLFSLFRVKKDKKIIFFWCVALFSTLIIFDIGPFLNIISKFPIFSSNPSTRLTVLVSFSLTVLSAYGLDFILKKASTKTLKKLLPFFIFIVLNTFALILLRTISFTKGIGNLDSRISKELSIVFMYLINALFFIWLYLSRKISIYIFILIILVVTFLDLYRVGADYNPTLKTELFYPKTQAIELLQNYTKDYSRILAFDKIMFLSAPSYYDLNSLTFTDHYNNRWVNFMNYIQPESIQLQRETIKFKKSKLDLENQLLDLVGVKYILDYSWEIPIWKIPFVQVKNYNLPITMKKGDMLSRTFKINKNQEIDGISLRVKKYEKADNVSLLIRINDLNTNKIFEEWLVSPDKIISGETLDISFEETIKLYPSKYSITIQWNKNSDNVITFWGASQNPNKKRKLSKNNVSLKSDLSFSLYQEKTELKDKFKLVYNDEVKIYENQDVFDRVFLTHKLVSTNNKEETFNQLTELEKTQALHSTAVVEDSGSNISLEQCNDISSDKVDIVEYNANKVTMTSKSQCDSILILSDLYDSDWDTYMDNDLVETLKVDYLLRGVYIPKGDHTIIFKYKPKSFTLGLRISLITVSSIFLFFITIPISKYANKRIKT